MMENSNNCHKFQGEVNWLHIIDFMCVCVCFWYHMGWIVSVGKC
jgi:hypothetical protein